MSLVPCVCLRGGECAALSLSLEEESFICLETPGTCAREHMKIFLHLFQLNVPSISRWITFSFPFYSCHFYFSPSWLVNNKFPPIINVRATDLPWKKIKKFQKKLGGSQCMAPYDKNFLHQHHPFPRFRLPPPPTLHHLLLLLLFLHSTNLELSELMGRLF